MIAFYKDFILEFFSENSWLGLKSKISNNEKENLEYKLNFLSVSLTHFKLIFHFFFFFFVVASSVICLQSKSGQKDLNKKFEFRLSWKDWFNLSQTKILAKPDSRRNQIPSETRFPAKPDSQWNQIPGETEPVKPNPPFCESYFYWKFDTHFFLAIFQRPHPSLNIGGIFLLLKVFLECLPSVNMNFSGTHSLSQLTQRKNWICNIALVLRRGN